VQSAVRALCDAGPLVALFDPGDTQHARCRTALQAFNGRLLTTWPVLTEVFHFIEPGRPQRKLWEFILTGGVIVVDLLREEMPRLSALMEEYRDLPMELADGTLVILAERLRLRQAFTLDHRHFVVYRPRHIRSFEMFP
jgi:uncharacterized protein